MFTVCPSGSGGIIQVARPSASSGAITNPTNAYDLPSGRADDPPYSTYATSGTITGSATAGVADFVNLEWNTFPSRSKSNFSTCELVCGLVYTYYATQIVNLVGGGHEITNYVIPSLQVQYQIDGSNWVTIRDFFTPFDDVNIGPAQDNAGGTDTPVIGYSSSLGSGVGSTYYWNDGVQTLSVKIPASSFPANLDTLKVRFVIGTCTSTVGGGSYKSSATVYMYDIRANIY